MRREEIVLRGSPLGSQRSITALFFGPESASRKIYIQASLHADELPGALTAYHLRHLLRELEQAGQLRAQIVLVPLANPIGLAQSVQFMAHGRFDLWSGQNFNRMAGLDLYPLVAAKLKAQSAVLMADASANQALIRRVLGEVLAEYSPASALESLHVTLLQLAHDADVVLDLHCDVAAVLHVYTLPELWPTFEPLARLLGSGCQLLARDSGVAPFDETLSTLWPKLQADYPAAQVPNGCASVTVELRGQADLSHELAQADAQAIVQFLAHRGDVAVTAEPLPELLRAPHPLAGAQYIHAPSAGVVVYHVQAGQWVEAGAALADVVDPLGDSLITVYSPVAGLVYARNEMRFAQQGDTLLSLSGMHDLGRGAHLSP
ncbi:MAG: M14 family metallopeptidase [Formosimonas sp.]